MRFKVKLTYSEPLLRQAVFAFWRRTFGMGFFIALAVLASSLAWLLWRGDRSWLIGAVGAVLGFGLVFAALVYVIHLHTCLKKFRAMNYRVAEMDFDESSLALSSDLGRSSMRWSAVTEIWCYPNFWLILFSKAQFVTLPLVDVPAEVQAFIRSQVSSAGGKVS